MKILLLVAALCASACGGKSTTAPTPPTAQIAGVWRGTATTTSVTGGECFAATLQTVVGGSSMATAAVTQSGANVSATFTTQGSGGSCVYSGNVGASALILTFVSCTASNVIGARCPTGTATRDILLQSGSFNGTVNGSSITGTSTELYNVVIGGTATGVGTATFINSYSLTRQ